MAHCGFVILFRQWTTAFDRPAPSWGVGQWSAIMFSEASRRTLVVAPHMDDEVLGCGGTIARLADAGSEVHVAVVTTGRPPRFEAAAEEDCRKEAIAAHGILGVHRTHFLDLPAAELDMVPHAELNQALGEIVGAVAPDMLLLPFNGDVHLDHQLIFNSGMVAARPNRSLFPTRLWAYETLSETNWNAPYLTPGFHPTIYVDIAATLDRKIAAMRAYASQLRLFPDERSIEAIEALAWLRGAAVHRPAAEAFVALREVL
jgi:LmbE family N-acetylglucosaminyl deacetylase